MRTPRIVAIQSNTPYRDSFRTTVRAFRAQATRDCGYAASGNRCGRTFRGSRFSGGEFAPIRGQVNLSEIPHMFPGSVVRLRGLHRIPRHLSAEARLGRLRQALKEGKFVKEFALAR